ncbi:MAG: ATP-grasp domain-containing protein [Deltaproteobacteria bacterium]|nr:ATP-grasp domain-containing protein [Deltaproteobacteria bacterium]
MTENRTLVVGTTPDYVDWLRRKNPSRLLFLSERRLREQALECPPDPGEELLCELAQPEGCRDQLRRHLENLRLTLDGVVCYDCEALPLAARLAKDFGLPFASPEAVRLCRDKHLSKSAWRQSQVSCPESRRLTSETAAAELLTKEKQAWVFKPACGGGSEFVYLVKTRATAKTVFRKITKALKQAENQLLFCDSQNLPAAVIAEEFIDGREFSVDFRLEENRVEILRLTEKIARPGDHFGTIRGYGLNPAGLSTEFEERLKTDLLAATKALLLHRALGMADFILKEGRAIFLEITPRPGGDCLPALLQAAGPFDILEEALNFARAETAAPKRPPLRRLAALRFHAETGGLIRHLDSQTLLRDRRVLACRLSRAVGDRVTMPPQDYDSWLLGHLIFMPRANEDLARQCHELHALLKVEIEP